MKGIAAWIWIMSTIVLGILVFTAGSMLIMRYFEDVKKEGVIEQVTKLYTSMETVCLLGGVGDFSGHRIDVPEFTRAIYVANASDELPPDKVSDYITKSKTNMGNYLCLQFADENYPRCRQVSCYMNMTYMGRPSLKESIWTIVSRTFDKPTYKYRVLVNKTDYKFLTIEGVQIIAEITKPTTTTSTSTTSTTIQTQV